MQNALAEEKDAILQNLVAAYLVDLGGEVSYSLDNWNAEMKVTEELLAERGDLIELRVENDEIVVELDREKAHVLINKIEGEIHGN
jgi:hypothetical protein